MSKRELRLSPNKGLGVIEDVPIPSQSILNYAKEHDLLRFKGLALHTLTTIVVANALVIEIDKANSSMPSDQQFDVNSDLIFETIIATHSARPLADDGVAGRASEDVNSYMRDHTDIDLAEKLATGENLPLTVVQEIDHLRGSQGFPERTIGPNNPYSPQTIDWNDAVNQISSWSVAGTIQPIDGRFEDLIRRHASQSDSPKKLTREELLRYEKWGKARIVDFSRHIGIDPGNFLEHLRGKLFEGVPSAQEKSDSLIRTLFKREPSESEFLPVSLPYKYLATSIMTIENPGRRRVVEAMLAKPGRFLDLAKGYGLIASG